VNIGHNDNRGAPRDPSPPRGLERRWIRRVVSCWLVFHLAAIIIAPAAVPPASELAGRACEFFLPYLGALYLDHGYHFFAPEPVASTLLRYVAERGDGTVIHGQLPDRETQPRLLYHRYFMLSERMSEAPEGLERAWHASYAEHIARQHGATRVTLIERIHKLPTMERIREGGRLDDPEGFEERELGVFP
jgi:hypothetical protein